MRIAGFFILTIFFPAFAHAAPPTLTTYTISHNTIYPSATSESGFATTTSIDIAFSESVKASIKIMSTSIATSKSLYSSSSVTNPAPKVWDGTNTAGAFVSDGTYTILISATSTTTGLSMTDSSKTITVAVPDTTPPEADDTKVSTAANSASPEYLPIPVLRIFAGTNRTVSSGADTTFTAIVYDSKGNKRDEALVRWSFGDGMQRTGASVLHAYYDPGEYAAVVRATTPDGGNARSEMIITVKSAGIRIVSVSPRGITLANDDSRTLDLSLWRLAMGGREFKIPVDTQILAGRTILFPSRVIDLPITDSASLLYPSGEVASLYPKASTVSHSQPTVPVMGYREVQTVDPIISTRTNVQSYDAEVRAPATATKLAAAGAALPPALLESAPLADTRASSFFRSPWTLSFLGVLILAGTAFILL